VIVAVVSGKGGTGKTTVATSLARAWSLQGPIVLADCDAEGPNAHHFLPDLVGRGEEPVDVAVPAVDDGACDRCGTCADACVFHALAVLPDRVLVFDPLCHGCGGCILACPNEAMRERARRVGAVRYGRTAGLEFVQGVLTVGEARSIPVIDAVIERARDVASADADIVLDGPPGASCPVAQVARAADVCLLVTEPTPFGLHDLTKAYELIHMLGKPAAAVLNRARIGEEDRRTEDWCLEQAIPLLLSIPDQRSVAEAYARGESLLDTLPGIRDSMVGLREPLRRLAEKGKSGVAA
jgi:MinD superfamily P-loop ATPase